MCSVVLLWCVWRFIRVQMRAPALCLAGRLPTHLYCTCHLTHPLSLEVSLQAAQSGWLAHICRPSSCSCSASSSASFNRASLRSTSPNWSRKLAHLLAGSAFVNPSAIMLSDGTYSSLIIFRVTSCRSQWLCISTCRSLVSSLATSSFTSRIVCVLSHLIEMIGSLSVT